MASIAQAEPTKPLAATYRESSHEVAMAKIEPALVKDLASEGPVEVIIVLKKKLDSEAVASAARKDLQGTMTPAQVNRIVARRVVEKLKVTAETSQDDLISYLEQAKEKGAVTSFDPFYVVNAIYVEADRGVIEDIAYRSEVAEIFKNEKHQYITPMVREQAVPEQADLEWNIERVKANLAWDLGIDGTGVTVANMDTGVDWTHPALMNKWRGYDPVTEEVDPMGNWFDAVYGSELPEDPHGHGTHVMGTTVGQEADGSNKIGVAPGARWIAVRILDESGFGSDLDILSGAQWILAPEGNADLAPDIVNNSWGGGPGIDDWFRDAVVNWRAAGIFPVVAAGNQRPGEPPPGPGSISVPGNYPESFAVAATDSSDRLAGFSLLGPSPYDPGLIKPEISAPGVDIRSSVPGGGYEGGWSGTSMAAPAVTGTAALLLSADQSLTVDDLAVLLSDTTVPLTDQKFPASPNFGYGYGLVDAFEAVAAVAEGTGFVTGKVLVEGSDTELPVINHEQTVFETFANAPVNIQAGISDDVSVVSADLLVRPAGADYWFVTPMRRIEGDHRSGNWQGTISPDMYLADSLTYRIRAVDYDGNEVVSAEFAITLSFGARPGYREGFETDASGWSFSGDWQFGAPVPGWDPPVFEGEQVAGTILGGPHSSQTKSWLISPPLDLRDDSTGEASLRFHHWYSTFDRYAYGQVMVSADNGGTWQTASPKYFGMDHEWREYAVDLSAYVGSPDPVYVAFYFQADTWATMEGWYIDDVQLMGEDTEAPAAPQELTASTVLGGVALNWWPSPEGDVTHYEVYRSETSGGPWTLLAEPTGAHYLDTTAPLDVTQYYAVRALDFSGNASDYSNEASAMAKPYVPLFGSDFEADDGGMVKGTVSGENDWAWGIPESGPSRARSGEKLWGTNLTGDYLRNSSYYIETPAIELAEGSEPILSFNHWYETEGDEFYAADFGTVEISADDGRTWSNITPDPGVYAGRVRQWLQAEIPLTGYEGSTVKIRFLFTTDGGIEYYGWYVDDVYVMGIDEVPAPAVKVQPEVRAASQTLKMESPLTGQAEADPEYPTMTLQEVEAIPTEITGIPAQGATVTVLETGRTVSTDPATGVYSMRMRTGEYTLVAESYGYEPEEAGVTIEEDVTKTQSFFLTPSPRGSITGRVVDRYYGDPAAFAEIRLLEDPNVAQVTADADGYFTMPDVLVGDYTLRVTADGFESAEFPVTVAADEVTEVELGLKRFVGYGGEIIYDDGSAEDALILFQPPNGVAVRFTPEQFGKVQGVNIFLWDESFPLPGGNRLGFNVYGIDENGQPYPAGEPIYRDDLVRGEWNYIDLSSLGFSTEGDFFISTTQDQPGELGPAVGLDYDSPYGDRSYLNIGGDFMPLADEGFPGGFMLRAIVMNTVSTPVFTNLTEVNYTNQDVITVEGAVDYDGIVNLYLNGEKEVTVVSEGGVFTAEVPVPLTENTLMATAELDGIETEPSPEVLIIKDQTEPELEVFTPEDGLKTNSEAIHVTGNATDEYLAEVLVNGAPVAVTENGDFDHRIFVEPGENLITIEARDLAGNVTQVERTVIVQTGGLSIRAMKPAVDLEVEAGDEVTFSFRSDTTGGEASYAIMLPINPASVTRTAMTEEEPGFYTATWTVPASLRFRDARVSFELLDGHGNRAEATAPGTLSIGITPTKRIAGTNRYRTAVEASRAAFKSADTVILVSGETFPDALAGAPLAGIYEAPILLTGKDRVSEVVLAEIQRLSASRVILLGGENAISEAVAGQLAAYDVERIAGSNRSRTAISIGDRVIEATGSSTAILVNGYNFPDALSVGPAAAIAGQPIVFTQTDRISQATLDALMAWGIENVTIIGGGQAVSEGVAGQLKGLGYTVDRVQGANRYRTALAVAERFFGTPDSVVIASGENFPDAMSGAPLAMRYGAPVLLVQEARVGAYVLDYLEEKGIRKAFILGGNAVISDSVVRTIEAVIELR